MVSKESLYEVPLTTMEKMQPSLQRVLELPLTSLTKEYKCSKVRLQMTLKDSRDKSVSTAASPLVTGWKWTPFDAVQQAISALKHKDTVGQVQQEV